MSQYNHVLSHFHPLPIGDEQVDRYPAHVMQQRIGFPHKIKTNVIWFLFPAPFLIGFVHNRNWNSAPYLLVSPSEKNRQKEEVHLLREGGGERSKRGPDEASTHEDTGDGRQRWRPWQGRDRVVSTCVSFITVETGGTPLQKQPDYLGLKFLRLNLQCDWSPVTDRTNIRPTVISFFLTFTGRWFNGTALSFIFYWNKSQLHSRIR